MSRKPSQPADEPVLEPLLRIPRAQAREQLLSRIEIGRGMIARDINSGPALKQARSEYYTWTEYNDELLRRMFTTNKFAEEYSFFIGISGGRSNIVKEIEEHIEDIRSKIRKLESVAHRLDLIDEVPGLATPQQADKPSSNVATTRKVFVVHGRDGQMKESVARFLERLEFEPVILAEQPNSGRTVIEKFEAEADVGFAVILLSPDDVGRLAEEESGLQERARQNVILELGYFVGRLGRSRVCALKKGNLELPSDFVGVAYTPFGTDEGWKLKLAQELRAAGQDVDFNRM